MTTDKHRNSINQARYRARHRRIDYAPSPGVLAVIEHHRGQGLDTCLAGVIDRLVSEGHKAITGNKRDADTSLLGADVDDQEI